MEVWGDFASSCDGCRCGLRWYLNQHLGHSVVLWDVTKGELIQGWLISEDIWTIQLDEC